MDVSGPARKDRKPVDEVVGDGLGDVKDGMNKSSFVGVALKRNELASVPEVVRAGNDVIGAGNNVIDAVGVLEVVRAGDDVIGAGGDVMKEELAGEDVMNEA